MKTTTMTYHVISCSIYCLGVTHFRNDWSEDLGTYTSDSSFLFFSSFFSFSSSWEASPFCTRSSFCLTWSSMLSTWEPNTETDAPLRTGTTDCEKLRQPGYIKGHVQFWISSDLPRVSCPLRSTCWTWPCWSQSSQRTVSTWGQMQSNNVTENTLHNLQHKNTIINNLATVRLTRFIYLYKRFYLKKNFQFSTLWSPRTHLFFLFVFTPEPKLAWLFTRCPCSTHHELTLSQTLQRDGAKDPGLVAALLSYLCALLRQLPVFGGAQLGWDHLDSRKQTRQSPHLN